MAATVTSVLAGLCSLTPSGSTSGLPRKGNEMAMVPRHFDDEKIAAAVEAIDQDDVLEQDLKVDVQFSAPVANGFPTGTITVTRTYRLERDDVEEILVQAQ